MQTKLYNQDGQEIGQTELSDGVFGVPMNVDLVHQVRVGLLANQRKPVAHTKDRSDVRGGGKKPWRQKGTGRARHGSTRSPIWKGGGVSHGPRNDKNYSQKINLKVGQLGLKMALSAKLKNDRVMVVEKLDLAGGKTKDFKNLISKLGWTGKSLLVVTSSPVENLTRASANLPKTKVVSINDLGLLDVLKFHNIILTTHAVNRLAAK